MSKNWWYVEGSDRKGPVEESELANFLETGVLNSDSYIWTKGFENWVKFHEVDELSHLLGGGNSPSLEPEEPAPSMEMDRSPAIEKSSIDLNSIGINERVFYIKTGMDRNANDSGAEYGPFSLDQLKRLFEENRINEKTYIFTTGMDNWTLLADFEVYSKISGTTPPEVKEDERRAHVRKPFVANMYFHDQSQLYEGVCRDISVGGMQVLVSNFPGKINDEVTMNVHPENSEYCFVASGKIVRILDGNSGFSLRFDSIGDDARGAINNYLESN
ncbi:MAG: hypothetical protein CME70_05590 [Halobacteriovorax sp.]|nr:hypothetical protein [Halobacteriovorax sp.]|tara:strand:+ start:5599 stop:6417 length:819 start_codon:yes stop_codon:yes gene_type:complete